MIFVLSYCYKLFALTSEIKPFLRQYRKITLNSDFSVRFFLLFTISCFIAFQCAHAHILIYSEADAVAIILIFRCSLLLSLVMGAIFTFIMHVIVFSSFFVKFEWKYQNTWRRWRNNCIKYDHFGKLQSKWRKSSLHAIRVVSNSIVVWLNPFILFCSKIYSNRNENRQNDMSSSNAKWNSTPFSY